MPKIGPKKQTPLEKAQKRGLVACWLSGGQGAELRWRPGGWAAAGKNCARGANGAGLPAVLIGGGRKVSGRRRQRREAETVDLADGEPERRYGAAGGGSSRPARAGVTAAASGKGRRGRRRGSRGRTDRSDKPVSPGAELRLRPGGTAATGKNCAWGADGAGLPKVLIGGGRKVSGRRRQRREAETADLAGGEPERRYGAADGGSSRAARAGGAAAASGKGRRGRRQGPQGPD
ncbi:uncharacterized protein LOC131060018 [Cryptomeria japonica]|uniref:uncharacterized protein LOC131060018 n=1 Tax=Cryptomeria japonica TaxID=3369 RepID=UPI0027DA5907|nr:uncharacterized protein LOC131060018 [Cryptomeria japonica]